MKQYETILGCMEVRRQKVVGPWGFVVDTLWVCAASQRIARAGYDQQERVSMICYLVRFQTGVGNFNMKKPTKSRTKIAQGVPK